MGVLEPSPIVSWARYVKDGVQSAPFAAFNIPLS